MPAAAVVDHTARTVAPVTAATAGAATARSSLVTMTAPMGQTALVVAAGEVHVIVEVEAMAEMGALELSLF